jgi:hypothetical protein
VCSYTTFLNRGTLEVTESLRFFGGLQFEALYRDQREEDYEEEEEEERSRPIGHRGANGKPVGFSQPTTP